METSRNLSLPYIAAGQALKHITHNEAIQALDAIVWVSAIDRDLTAPPGSPADGDTHIVAAGATGAWTGWDQTIAAWQDGAWVRYTPNTGWQCFIAGESVIVHWDGGQWADLAMAVGPLQNLALLGINATADALNKLAVKSAAILFDHDGSGTQVKLNKNGAGETASLLYQTGYSGRAEIGLTGDDDFHFKVSPDGSAFHEAILIGKDDGWVSAPSGGIREQLRANRTYYVDPAGSDASNGLSSGSPFLTIARAISVCEGIDANGHSLTIQLASGTYDQGAGTLDMHTAFPGLPRITISGDTATPANVVISTSGLHLFSVRGVSVSFEGVTFDTGTGSCLLVCDGAAVRIAGVRFGSAGRYHMEIEAGSVRVEGNYEVFGGATGHVRADAASYYGGAGHTVTITGTPAFSGAFVQAVNSGAVSISNFTFTGTATGKRYTAELNGTVNTFGEGATFLPGDVAGTLVTGGQYA